MIKFTGLLLIFICFSSGGCLFVKREKERIEAEEGMLYLIRNIRQNIAFLRKPLDEIYKQFSYPALERGKFLTIMREEGLQTAYLSEKECFGYDSFTEARFITFAENIGKLPLEEQLRSCDMLSEVLEEKLKDAKTNFPNKKKLYQALGISLGLAFVILFV